MISLLLRNSAFSHDCSRTIFWFPSLLPFLLFFKCFRFSIPSNLEIHSHFQFSLIYTPLCIGLLNFRYVPFYFCQVFSTVYDTLLPVSSFPFSVWIAKVKKPDMASSFYVIISPFHSCVLDLLSMLPQTHLRHFSIFYFTLQVLKSCFLSLVRPTGSAIINSVVLTT